MHEAFKGTLRDNQQNANRLRSDTILASLLPWIILCIAKCSIYTIHIVFKVERYVKICGSAYNINEHSQDLWQEEFGIYSYEKKNIILLISVK
jgi:hypothetical protein